ncbi:MAG: DNA-directed RNA polymerase subunit K [Candidatus Aenigmarchaeota archaeon]|nr:DNA-directed RNA polymerase subunit K [Candidatus Aenigmarchaeota archaeon]
MMWPVDEFTRFEVARLIGARALQIALGAPVLVKSNESDSILLAKEEFRKKMIPITVKRELPDKTKVSVVAKAAIANWMKRYNGEI